MDGAFFLILYLELPHQLLLFVRQRRQLAPVFGRGRRLGPYGMAHITNVADIAIDLVRHPALLMRRSGNLLVHLMNGRHRMDNLLQYADRQSTFVSVTSAWL